MLAIGMITCRRSDVDVHRAIEQLRFGGFDELLHVFCEPDTPEVRPLPNVVVHQNPFRRGVLGNWSHCLEWLLEHTIAEYLMVCEDDIAFARGARAAWQQSLNEFPRLGFWSLYTPRRDKELVGSTPGWSISNRGRDTWGTQAMCFPRSSARLLLEYSPLHEEDQFQGPTDAIVAQCFVDAGLPCYYHNPSLINHVGNVSSVGHNWFDDHVGLNFDPDFRPPNSVDTLPLTQSPTEIKGVSSLSARTAVVTVYQDNIPEQVVAKQAEVVRRFLPPGCEFLPRQVSHHAFGLDDAFRDLEHEAYLILDIDCIPLTPWVIGWMLQSALAGIVIGAAQRANHLNNNGHLYAGPCALAFSRATFDQLGRPSFRDTLRGDVAEELTYLSEDAGIPVSLLWPTHVTTPKWPLRSELSFGLGTTFGGAVYHAFEISKGQTVGMFLNKCDSVLIEPSTCGNNSLTPDCDATNPVLSRVSASPTYHEEWYAASELELLEGAVRFIRPLKGDIVELGCWEGRSTAVIAKACAPQTVVAVDTWQGNLSEGSDHETVRIARNRNVFQIFQANMRIAGHHNVSTRCMDVMDYLREGSTPIKFCHIDASHDYPSVRDTLQQLLPRLVNGGVLIGHDYETAHDGRSDLQGGVQRAVKELLPKHASRGNNWWYVHMIQ